MSSLIPFAARYWAVAGWTMLHFLWLGTLAWLVAVVTRRALERFSPQARYAWSLAWLGSFAVLSVALVIRIGTHGGLIESFPALATVPVTPLATAASQLNAPRINDPAARTLQASGSLPSIAPANSWSQAVAPAIERGATLLPWAWCLGTPLVALMFATGVAGTFRLRLRSRPVVDRAVLDVLARLQSTLHVGQRVLLAVTAQVTSPLVVGIVRPVILLPPSLLAGLSPDQLEMILLHELAHVRRWDNLVNLLQRVVEALLFYHPAVWWASRWVRLEREHCCDALVLAHGRDPQAYAETLASLALPELAPRYAAAAMANHQLVSRIRHILNVEKQAMGLSLKTLVWSGVMLVIAGIGCLVGVNLVRGQSALAQEAEGSATQGEPAERTLNDDVGSDAGTYELWSRRGAVFSDFDRDGDADVYLSGFVDVDRPRPWSPEQATGAPNVAEAGDNGNAWASLTEDDQEEWLQLSFEPAVLPAAVVIYESFNPGAVHKVGLINSDNDEGFTWEGVDPVASQDGKGVAVIPLAVNWSVKGVKLYLDSTRVAGWNEIDAVGLLDLATGEVHWAKSAQASSTYANRGANRATSFRERLTWKQCLACHVDTHGELTDHVLRGWKHGRTPVCPECYRPQSDMLLPSSQPGVAGDVPAASSLDHRRMRADQLRLELQALEADIARQEAEAARQADAEKRNASESAYAKDVGKYYLELSRLRQAPDAESRDTEATLQELAETLKQQQAAIDELTQALEALQSRIGDSVPRSSESEAESGSRRSPADPNGAAATNPLDERIKFSVSDLLLSAAQSDVDDATFLRRLMLDLTGTPPSPEMIRKFEHNTAPDKRQQVLKEILELSPPEAQPGSSPPRDSAEAP